MFAINLTKKIKVIATTVLLTITTSCAQNTLVEAEEEFSGEKWQQTIPEEVGLDSNKLEANFQNFQGPLVVVKDSYLVYSKGDITEPIKTYSVSKSLTSLIFATLLQQGKADYDDLIPGSNLPGTPKSSFRHFMTMTSDYGLTPHEPGKHYAYNNNAINFYGNYMATTFFQTKFPTEVLQKAIWDRIGRQDKVTFEGQWGGWDGGFTISTRDLARIGQLVLNKGNWKGTQILPPSFVKQLYINQIPKEATPNYDKGPNDKWNQHNGTVALAGNYSFGWWIIQNSSSSEGTKCISGSGWRGKELVVCPQYNLVIAAVPHQTNAPNAIDYVDAVTNSLQQNTK
jgi:CubicO group peptidase (beta-lactamase class C family)